MGKNGPHQRAVARAKDRIKLGEAQFPDAAAESDPLASYADEEVWAMQVHEQPSHALSARELQVVTGISYGLTDKMIGELYGISPHTVKTHVRRLQAKLKSKNRTHAACEALRRRLIQ